MFSKSKVGQTELELVGLWLLKPVFVISFKRPVEALLTDNG
jgi:hypothetical protein